MSVKQNRNPAIPRYAIICCAGLGERLGQNIPKCLIQIGGKTLLERQLGLLNGFEEVRIVVGFKKEDVIAESRRFRPDTVFIHNDIYARSTNAYSLHLASRDLEDPFLIIDGDILINKESFEYFLAHIKPNESLLGVALARTEFPVYTNTDDPSMNITGFSRTGKSPYEWCGIASLSGICFNADAGYVYEAITPHLPLRMAEIDCYEIDTPEDLKIAIEAFSTVGPGHF